MKNRLLRWTVIGLVCCAACVVTALASDAKKAEISQEMRDIITRYGLTVVDRVPPGVKALTASTPAELESLLMSVDARVDTSLALQSSGATLSATIGTNCRPYHWRQGGLLWYENLAANVYIDSYGSFTWISSIGAVRFYITGFTVGLDLNDVWTDWQIDPHNGQCATISGGGVIDMFILIPEAIVFRTFAVEMYRFVNIAQ
jgi:hypothetical protein